MIRAYACMAVVLLLTGTAQTLAAAPPEPEGLTDEQAAVLAMRDAQGAALRRLADRILDARLAEDQTIGEALGAGTEAEARLRVLLRSATMVGDPRRYSDGVTEVDVEIRLATVMRGLSLLLTVEPDERLSVPALEVAAVDGYLRASGTGRPSEEVAPERIEAAVAAPRDELPEVYPLGWRQVQPAGRIQAARDARIRAYHAMGERLRGVQVARASTVGDRVRPHPAAEVRLDTFLRRLPVQGRPRLMPDRVAELTVAAPVAALIEVLKELRRLLPPEARWTEEEVDALSLRLKADVLSVTGRGMPAEGLVDLRPAPANGPLPDWAARTLVAEAEAEPPERVQDPEQARVLAARAARARAAEALSKLLDEVEIAEGVTVHDRLVRDAVFKKDVQTLLESAKVAASRPTDEGRWEVVLALPLERLYGFARE